MPCCPNKPKNNLVEPVRPSGDRRSQRLGQSCIFASFAKKLGQYSTFAGFLQKCCPKVFGPDSIVAGPQHFCKKTNKNVALSQQKHDSGTRHEDKTRGKDTKTETRRNTQHKDTTGHEDTTQRHDTKTPRKVTTREHDTRTWPGHEVRG